MASDTFYTALDLGTSKVAAVVGKIAAAGDLKIVGSDVVPCDGLFQGRVRSVTGAREAIHTCIDQASRYLGHHRTSKVYVTFSGTRITSFNTQGEAEGAKDNGVVAPRDLDRLLQYSWPSTGDPSEVLHIIPIGYQVDGLRGVRNPLGLHARHVRVESHVVLASSQETQALVQLVQGCRLSVGSLVAQSLASGESVLSQGERELGVVLLDYGAGSVDMTIYRQGSPWYSATIPLGGIHQSRDLAVALSVPLTVAEELKLTWGHVLPPGTSPDAEVIVEDPQKPGPMVVTRRSICRPLQARLEETLGMVAGHIRRAGLRQLPPGGIVVTGGCAATPELRIMIGSMIGEPVRVASPQNVPGLPSALATPAFAACVGALLWGIKHRGAQRPYPTNGNHGRWGRWTQWAPLGRWGRDHHQAQPVTPSDRRRKG